MLYFNMMKPAQGMKLQHLYQQQDMHIPDIMIVQQATHGQIALTPYQQR